jgi:hypothetical protein
VHVLRRIDVEVVLEDVDHAALAGLAVDPDELLVFASEVGRVDVQVGHLPAEVEELAGLALSSMPFLMASDGSRRRR